MAGGRSDQHRWLQEGLSRGSMLGKIIRPTDEELGKKDDDHKPGAPFRGAAWGFPTPLRWRKRRILLAVMSLCLLYVLANAMPDLDLTSGETGSSGTTASQGGSPGAVDQEPTGVPPGIRLPSDGSTLNTFAGPIKFYRLSASLQSASYTSGHSTANRNVLFAVSSLRSATALLPMICEMANWKRNWVHAAFMGREDIPLADFLDINGIDKKGCPAIWHDARPSYTEYSTEQRAETSVIAALGHLHAFLHPQVIITNAPSEEDAFLTRGIRAKAARLPTPVVEIPKDRVQDLMWLTRLDSGSLQSWHKPTVDILIQAPSHSSGGVIRLLQSLKDADYMGFGAPRLTVELPADVDDTVKQYLENYHWPPGPHDASAPSQITIRRRIDGQHRTQEESAIRFLELFYPNNAASSHVLVLSPQVQLSPLYFHYVKYVLLEYKYSSYGESDAIDLMGATLELPATLLDGRTKLTLPKPSDMRAERYERLFSSVPSPQFLWQAPNSHATLFFGDKWMEFHSFLGNRVKKQHQGGKKTGKAKVVSETLPAWTEYLLELLRARGYSFLYPATNSAGSFATVHNELYHAPEEFPLPSAPSTQSRPSAPDEAFLRAESPASRPKLAEPPVISFSRPLHMALPFNGDLPELPHLPLLLSGGDMVSPEKSSAVASGYAEEFRTTVGGCPVHKGRQRRIQAGSADDLFCFGDEDEDEWVEDMDWDGGESSSSLVATASSSSSATVTMTTAPGQRTSD